VSAIEFRAARRDDLPAIVRLLADDPLGTARECLADPLPREYIDAFEAMARQGGNEIVLAMADGVIAGCLQLTVIPGLSRRGSQRAQIEAVRVDRARRGQGIGESLIKHAIERARAQGCTLVQLTTDKSRADAHRFYTRLGFVATHKGMKLDLSKRD
jgi:ribosomal protein S18 acetylase RimI-like enzyme